MNIVISILIATTIGIIGFFLGRHQERKHYKAVEFIKALEAVFEDVPNKTIKEQPVNPKRSPNKPQ